MICHNYSSLQAAAIWHEDDEDDECYDEIPPEELRARLGDVSAAALLAAFSGIDSSLLLVRACA